MAGEERLVISAKPNPTPGQLPPVNAFWSVTMYTAPESLLYANPLDRYLINSEMEPDLVRDADGGITLRSLTGYANKRVNNLYDSDATSLNTAALPASTQDQFVREREVVQEINLISPTTGRLNWIDCSPRA